MVIAMRHLSLRDKFEKLRSDHPKLTEGAEPLGSGAFGIVISQPDDKVMKVLFDHAQEDSGLLHLSRSMFKREIEFFKAMEPIATPGLDIPRLIEEPTMLKGGRYIAHYTMTRLPGNIEYWPEISKDNPGAFYNALGQMLGKLHRAFDKVDPSLRRELSVGYKSHIVAVNSFDDVTNERLMKADALLQALKKPGFIHGDFHAGNIMINRGKASGALDLSSAAYVDNMYDDLVHGTMFSWVPPEYADTVNQGYSETSGTEVDPLAFKCSILSRTTHMANWNVGEHGRKAAELTKETLNETARLAYRQRRAVEGLNGGPA